MFGLSISDSKIVEWIERAVNATERIAGSLERIRDVFEGQAVEAAEEAEQIADAIDQASNSNESNRS